MYCLTQMLAIATVGQIKPGSQQLSLGLSRRCLEHKQLTHHPLPPEMHIGRRLHLNVEVRHKP